jgi:hypothetical protein
MGGRLARLTEGAKLVSVSVVEAEEEQPAADAADTAEQTAGTVQTSDDAATADPA